MTQLDQIDVISEPTLEDLATVALREHQAVQVAISDALTHALLVGEALLSVRRQLSGIQWTRWISTSVPEIQLSQAQVYMRLARYREIVADAGVSNLDQAKQLLVGLPSTNHRGRGRPASPEVMAQAVQLVEEGLKPKAVAAMLGVSENRVRRWTDAEAVERQQERHRRRRDRMRVQAEETRVRAARELARKRGGGIAKAYSLAEQMQDALGQAHGEADSQEARSALAVAGEHYRQMRDEIVRALGLLT